MASRVARTNAVTVGDVLEGHKLLEIDCVDRVYLTLSVPSLVVGGQVVSFLTAHERNPIPSPALLERRGAAFRRAVASFAEASDIPVLSFAGKRDKGPTGAAMRVGSSGGGKETLWSPRMLRRSRCGTGSWLITRNSVSTTIAAPGKGASFSSSITISSPVFDAGWTSCSPLVMNAHSPLVSWPSSLKRRGRGARAAHSRTPADTGSTGWAWLR